MAGAEDANQNQNGNTPNKFAEYTLTVAIAEAKAEDDQSEDGKMPNK